MKRILLFLLFPIFGNAQVGINTATPHTSSILDLTAADKGLLIPRVSLTDLNSAAPITAPATSLLVYNTNATTETGFYYWSGTNWTPFRGANNDWIISGNNIYNANSGNVGVGTTTPMSKLHIEDLGSSPLNENFENNNLGSLTTNGSQPWQVQNTQIGQGLYSAASGTITHSQQSNLTANVNLTTAGTLSFRYRVSSEGTYDKLLLLIDGVQQGAGWSGNTGWITVNYPLTAGAHTLIWRYLKDSSVSSGEDKAYLDSIYITSGAGNPLRIVDGNQSAGKVLTSDASGNATWQTLTNSSIPNLPQIITVGALTIPICNLNNVNATGNFTKTINGVNTTITWKILQKQTASTTVTATTPTGTATVTSGPVRAERLQIEYTFSPALPFVPNTIMFTVNNNTSLPDVFTLNYASKSTNTIVVNVARTDLLGNASDSPCWAGQFYFDLFLTN